MAFWKKKSEDPWDLAPSRPKKPAAAPAPAEEQERTIPPWVHHAEQPDPIPCPWCGEPMLVGFLYGSSRGGMQWREGPWRGGLDAMRFTGRKIDLGGSETAWYCTSCKKNGDGHRGNTGKGRSQLCLGKREGEIPDGRFR